MPFKNFIGNPGHSLLWKRGPDTVVGVFIRDEKHNDKQESIANIPLHEACRKGDLHQVGHVLSWGLVDINIRDMEHGKTPLMAAAHEGHYEKQNDFETSPEPKVDKQETFANSSLHEACRRGDLNRVERMLSQGLVDINIRDKENGKTPLMVAAKEGHCRIFDLLIRKGANMSEVNNDGKNALHWACKGGHVGMLKCVLQQYRKNVNDRKIRLLALAAYSGQKDLCEFLVCMGTNVSGHYQGRNALDFACRGGHVDVVKYLLSQGCVDINSRRKDGKTPLMGTASVGRRVAFDFLVRRGANMSLVDDEGYNVLHIAASLGQTEIIQSIISNDIVDINSRGRNGTTPLMRAACTGHMDVFGLLVRNGGLADLVDDNGGNILHLASSGGHVEMVKHILSRKLVDINDRDKDGKTAAMIAKRDRKRNVLDFLVSQGCPVK
ncbi:ankyrin repeat domain-containing protein 50-like [Haliotis rubra]|uniref:ankyrin repeat domain-containing protein 50-like n=1 Tax=Haliotis rubra TaxID=36100 RepID=UPI001EE609D8|nr:ankyrin repeat domain-containing protein 50-like [Haliotis rubra]